MGQAIDGAWCSNICDFTGLKHSTPYASQLNMTTPKKYSD